MIVNVWQREREARREEAEKGAKELFPSHSLTASLPPSLPLPPQSSSSLSHASAISISSKMGWETQRLFPVSPNPHLTSFLPSSLSHITPHLRHYCVTHSVSQSVSACMSAWDGSCMKMKPRPRLGRLARHSGGGRGRSRRRRERRGEDPRLSITTLPQKQ